MPRPSSPRSRDWAGPFPGKPTWPAATICPCSAAAPVDSPSGRRAARTEAAPTAGPPQARARARRRFPRPQPRGQAMLVRVTVEFLVQVPEGTLLPGITTEFGGPVQFVVGREVVAEGYEAYTTTDVAAEPE